MSGGGGSNYTPPPTETPWIYKTDIAGGSTAQDSTATNPYGYWSGSGTTTPTSSDLQTFAAGGLLQDPMSMYASNQNFMQYQGQGQPNQPPMLSGQAPAVQNDGGPDAGGDYVGSSMGFDGSGSDAGVGGQPVNQMQTPLQSPTQQGNKPLGRSEEHTSELQSH